jgi:uncharacterized protein (DUF1778 family)
VPIIAGVRVPREQTLELAAMLTRDGSDHTARVLLDAITGNHEFVALTTDDREAILAVLDRPPEELVELRSALFAELAWRRNGLAPPRRRRWGFPLRPDQAPRRSPPRGSTRS